LSRLVAVLSPASPTHPPATRVDRTLSCLFCLVLLFGDALWPDIYDTRTSFFDVCADPLVADGLYYTHQDHRGGRKEEGKKKPSARGGDYSCVQHHRNATTNIVPVSSSAAADAASKQQQQFNSHISSAIELRSQPSQHWSPISKSTSAASSRSAASTHNWLAGRWAEVYYLHGSTWAPIGTLERFTIH
jgi:hypothetical protein